MKALNIYVNEKLVLNKDTFRKAKYKYFPETKEELKDIIKQLLEERKDQDIIDLNDIDTSEITDMSELFSNNYTIYKIDISKWDVSNVKDMYGIFYKCKNIDYIGDISSWNVSNVEDMSYMFYNCYNLESIGDISSWKISEVKYMEDMFRHCKNLKSVGDLSSWNISKVTDISCMFKKCEKLKDVGDLSNWNISKIKNMKFMFDSSGITNLPKWYIEK